MQGTAVLGTVLTGRAQPWRPKLCALIACSYVLSRYASLPSGEWRSGRARRGRSSGPIGLYPVVFGATLTTLAVRGTDGLSSGEPAIHRPAKPTRLVVARVATVLDRSAAREWALTIGGPALTVLLPVGLAWLVVAVKGTW